MAILDRVPIMLGSENEDAVHWPDKLRAHVVPRRGGVAVPVRKVRPHDRALIAERRDGPVRDLLTRDLPGERRSDPALVAAGRAEFGGESSPLGAAVVGALTAGVLMWSERSTLPALAESWLTVGGPVFAARTAAELGGIEVVEWPGGPGPTLRLTGQPRPDFAAIGISWQELARSVRVGLIDQPDDVLREVIAALAPYRRGGLMQRVVTSYLAPDQAPWVDADCALLATAPSGVFQEARMLAASVARADQLTLVADAGVYEATFFERTVATVLDGVGPAAAPQFEAWLDEPKQPVGTRRLLLSVLCGLPTDEALGALVRRHDDKATHPYLATAMERYPARASRVLASAGICQSTSST